MRTSCCWTCHRTQVPLTEMRPKEEVVEPGGGGAFRKLGKNWGLRYGIGREGEVSWVLEKGERFSKGEEGESGTSPIKKPGGSHQNNNNGSEKKCKRFDAEWGSWN